MLSLLRRVSSIPMLLSPTPISSSTSASVSSLNFLSRVVMDSSATGRGGCFGGSQRLMALARQLQLYKPPPTFDETEIREKTEEETADKVVSQVGFQESVTPVANQIDKFRPTRAAVLICLFAGTDGEFRVILTKRSSKLSTHSGEVALPGGKAEEADADDAQTATREASEEIGLNPSLVKVVTTLEPFLSKHTMEAVDHREYDLAPARCQIIPICLAFRKGLKLRTGPCDLHLLRVIPVIGILPDKKLFKPTPSAAEVEAVFDAPLEMFLKDENRRFEEREWMGGKYLIHFFDYETDGKKYLIWGLTAGILIRAASVVYQRPPAFLEQKPKFKLHNTSLP